MTGKSKITQQWNRRDSNHTQYFWIIFISEIYVLTFELNEDIDWWYVFRFYAVWLGGRYSNSTTLLDMLIASPYIYTLIGFLHTLSLFSHPRLFSFPLLLISLSRSLSIFLSSFLITFPTYRVLLVFIIADSPPD